MYVYFAFYSVILYLGNTHIYLLKVLCCIKNLIVLKFMTESGKHTYKSLTLMEDENYKLLLHAPAKISSSFMHVYVFYL
jgi:hypothetical protein